MRFDLGGQGDDAIFLLMPGFIVDLYLYIYIHILLWSSLPKFKIAPENRPSQKEINH